MLHPSTRHLVLALAITLPVTLEVPSDSTLALPGEYRIRIAGGGGEYGFVTRGCEGNVIDRIPVHYREGSADLSIRFDGLPVRAGVRGGSIRDDVGLSEEQPTRVLAAPEDTVYVTRYVNPYIAYETRRGSVGLGWVAHEGEFLTASEGARQWRDHPMNDLSGHLLIGHPERRYFAVRWMESVPLYSGGGYLTIGFGGRTLHRPLELYLGLATGGPAEGASGFIRGDYATPSGLHVEVSLRGGGSANNNAFGGALGLQYRGHLR